jgi:hypothetical protein
MKIPRLFAVLLLVALAIPLVSAQGQEKEAMGMPPMGPPEEMKALAFMEGEWDVEVKWRMDPEAEWTTETATASNKSILSGAVHQSHWKGTMMGMPFEGLEIKTYDREEKRYESIWVDNMGARTSHMSGQLEGDKMVMEGEDLHEGAPYKMRMTMEKRSNDELFYIAETSYDGGETWGKTMEMVYKRKSS